MILTIAAVLMVMLAPVAVPARWIEPHGNAGMERARAR
ncbi:MAG: hypothetical protein ACI83P_000275, partial [Janthinobacterium sp.]